MRSPDGVRAELIESVLYPVAVFLGVIVLGVTGFVYLADVPVTEAAFWLIDPTSVELHYLERPGGEERAAKLLSIALRALIVLTGAWIAESVLSTVFGGNARREIRNARAMREIESLEDHVVVCGYGMFGETIAERLAERGEDVVVIELEPADHERVLDDGHLSVNGDCRREEALRKAGVDRARSVVAAVDDSNVNVETSIVVRQIAPDCRLVVRVGDRMYESLARRAGADEVVIPEVMTGESLTDVL